MSRPIDRRDFMHRATGAGAAISLSLAGPSTRKVLGANDRVRVGAIGTGRQALSNMKAFQKHGAEVVAVCDVYEPNLAKGKAQAGEGAAVHKDFRRVLDDKTIDMVIVATPDHWHALPMVMACQAGKDVFVEKPVAVAVEEGKAMLAAARKHQRVVQVGLWQRSNAHFQQAVQVVRSGLLGKVTYVRAWNYSNSSPVGIGNPPDADPPAGLDWDMWLGPAPKVPFNANRFGVRDDRWSTFRYFWDYSNGILGDWGVHHLDIVQWALDTPGPRTITVRGAEARARGQRRRARHADRDLRVPGVRLQLRVPRGERQLDVRQGLRPAVPRHRGHDAREPLGLRGVPRDAQGQGRQGRRALGRRCDGRGGQRAREPRGQHARVHADAESARPATSRTGCARRRRACSGSSRCARASGSSSTRVKQELKNPSGAAKKLFGREYRAPWKLA